MVGESTKKKCEKEQAEIEFDKDYFQEPESKKKKNRKGKEEILGENNSCSDKVYVSFENKKTLIEGLDEATTLKTAADLKKLIKAFKKQFNCGGNINLNKVVLQGDLRSDIQEFLESQGIYAPIVLK